MIVSIKPNYTLQEMGKVQFKKLPALNKRGNVFYTNDEKTGPLGIPGSAVMEDWRKNIPPRREVSGLHMLAPAPACQGSMLAHSAISIINRYINYPYVTTSSPNSSPYAWFRNIDGNLGPVSKFALAQPSL